MEKLWGGRFGEEEMGPGVMDFSSSLKVDRVLAKYDCLSTKVHVEMLASKGILEPADSREITAALDQLLCEIQNGEWCPSGQEDIHSAVQEYVNERAPGAAKKMHTGRSRNEQVVNDVRLYCMEGADRFISLLKGLQAELVCLAEGNMDVIVPGYTHLNRAQPVLFPHLILAYTEMLDRDAERMSDARKRIDVSVMGSGALAGSALELDRKLSARKAGFSKISPNSMDAVSDRDFVTEFVWCLSMTAVHLSRISEDLILYSLPEFGFLDIGAAYCTGSSLMPQKKNPDILELIRGRTASSISALNSLLVLQKGLPHTYNRDLQEDKKPLFETVETVFAAIEMMTGLVSTITLNKDAALKALDNEFIYSTDIAEYLVMKGVAFKRAHDIVGEMVKKCIEEGISFSDLSVSQLKGFSDKLEDDVYGLLSPEVSVKGKKTFGSTNPSMVREQVKEWKKKLR